MTTAEVVEDEAVDELQDETQEIETEAQAETEAEPATEEQPAVAEAKPAEPPKKDSDALLKQIEDLEQECYVAEVEWEDRKAEAKMAKDRYEAKVGALRRMIRSAKNDADRPLLKQAEQVATPTVERADETPDESWRETPIEELSLGAGPEKHLREADIWTIGDLADFTSQPGVNLTDLAGIGPASAERISDRLVEFWAEHPEYCSPTRSEEPDDEEEDDEDSEAEE